MSTNELNHKKEQEETDKEKLGFFNRTWNYIKSSRLVGFISKVQNDKVFYNAYNMITSPAVSRIVSIVFAVLALSGVGIGAAVFAPQIAIPLAVASIAAVAIGAAIDSYMVRRTRKLHSESKHLSRHRLAKDVQDQMLTKDPKLAKVLESRLYKPEREDKKSVTDRYAEKASKTKSKVAAITLGVVITIVKNTVSLVEGIINRNPVTIIKVVGSSVVGLATSSYGNMTMSDKRREFREHIDKLRGQEDGPGYNDIQELKEAAASKKFNPWLCKNW